MTIFKLNDSFIHEMEVEKELIKNAKQKRIVLFEIYDILSFRWIVHVVCT